MALKKTLETLARVGRAIDSWIGDGMNEWDAHELLRYCRTQLAEDHLLPDVQLHIHEFFKDPPDRSKPMVDWVRGRILDAVYALLNPEVPV